MTPNYYCEVVLVRSESQKRRIYRISKFPNQNSFLATLATFLKTKGWASEAKKVIFVISAKNYVGMVHFGAKIFDDAI